MKLRHTIPLLLIAACSLAPDTQLPTDRIPPQWRNASATQSTTATAAWSDFGSATLQQLIATALANNTDLSAALARVEQARAATKIAGGGLYPQIDADGTASTSTSRSGGTHTSTGRSEAELSVAYELDLWQRNRNLADSALWQLRASENDRRALSILVSSEVARLYSGVLAYDARLTVAQKNLKDEQEVMRITDLRHKEGAVSGLEQAQQRTSVASTEAAIASLQNQRELFFNQLAQMVGTTPTQLQLGDEKLDALKTGAVQLGAPWELLARRPDIAAAEDRLRAANIDIGVARAEALPSLSLALNAGIAADPATTIVGLAASFFAPIFHGGALQGGIERSEAARNEQVAAYQGVLLQAFREVEDALTNFDAATKRRTALGIAADQARRADTIARARFDAGSIDYTTLLQTQTALLQAEDSYYSAVQEQLAADIDLIRALGGPPATAPGNAT